MGEWGRGGRGARGSGEGPGLRKEHRGHEATRQRLTPVAFGEQRRAGNGTEPLYIVRDVVAGELLAAGSRHRDGATKIERQRRWVSEDAEHGAGVPAALECCGGGARHGGGGAVLSYRDEQVSGHERDGHNNDSIPEKRDAGPAGDGAEPDKDC